MTSDIAKKILADMEVGKILTRKGDRYSPATLTTYQNAITWLLDFENKDGQDFSDIFFQDFHSFLICEGLAKNSIAVILQNLHAILRHEKSIFLPKLENAGTELTTAIYTTTGEIAELLAVDLSITPGYELVRDAYVLHCSVGLRFSDFKKVCLDLPRYLIANTGNHYINVKTGKTGDDVVIPLNSTAREVLKKRTGSGFGELFSLQYYNKSIKYIGYKAGITAEVVKTRTQGGRKNSIVYKKCQLMASHTARRTFATNAFLAGVPERKIMKITGHKTEAAFRRYLRADALESALSLADHPFFK